MDITQYVCWDTSVYGVIKTIQKFLKSSTNKYKIVSIQYLTLNNKIYGIVIYDKKGYENV